MLAGAITDVLTLHGGQQAFQALGLRVRGSRASPPAPRAPRPVVAEDDGAAMIAYFLLCGPLLSLLVARKELDAGWRLSAGVR